MKDIFPRIIQIILFLSFFAFSSTAFANDYSDGLKAYKKNDYKKAFVLFKKSAEQGNAMAQLLLGAMYSRGEGVAQDYVQAHKWFNIAFILGNEKSRKNRDFIAKGMTSEQISQAQKLASEWLENFKKHSK